MGMDVAQPIWLTGCPKEDLFIAKKAKNFASSPSKSGTNYEIEWMELNLYDYCGFQPKTIHPKHSWGECMYSNLVNLRPNNTCLNCL